MVTPAAGAEARGMINSDVPDPSNAAPARRLVGALTVSLAAVCVALAVIGVATAVEQRANPPTCVGLGFGCTPDAGSSVVLVGTLFAPPVIVVAWLLSGLGWTCTRRGPDARNRLATWWPSLVLCAAVGGLALLALVTAG
jgi:hypothetical protein